MKTANAILSARKAALAALAPAVLGAALWLPPQSAAAGTVTVAALDNTGTVEVDREAICAASVTKVATALEPGDTLVLVSIDDVPFSRKRAFFSATLSPKSDNPLHVRLARNQFEDAVRAALAGWMKTSAQKTRVADAMLWAADYLASNQAEKKNLTVCSDGIEENANFNFASSVPPDALKRLAAAGFAPKDGLAGVQVSWVGLGGGKSASHVQAVRKLWSGYFESVGAKVVLMQRNGL